MCSVAMDLAVAKKIVRKAIKYRSDEPGETQEKCLKRLQMRMTLVKRLLESGV